MVRGTRPLSILLGHFSPASPPTPPNYAVNHPSHVTTDAELYSGSVVRLASLFYDDLAELGGFEPVTPAELPAASRRLLAHNDHMTVTLEAESGCPVVVRALAEWRDEGSYARNSLLSRQTDGSILQFGIMRIWLADLPVNVQEEITVKQRPLGRVLVDHNLLREVELITLWRIAPGPRCGGICQTRMGERSTGVRLRFWSTNVPPCKCWKSSPLRVDMTPKLAEYDCVVIGGGPSGSTAASLVADAGYRVLLLERDAEPRRKVGESLMPETYWVFERLGVLDKLYASAFVRKVGVQFVSSSQRESSPFLFTRHDPRACGRTWHVESRSIRSIAIRPRRRKGRRSRSRCPCPRRGL